MDSTSIPSLASPPWIETLHGLGAHFVLCGPDKRPVETGWQKRLPTAQEARQWSERGGLLGVMPGSLHCAVMDVDLPPGLKGTGSPPSLAHIETRRLELARRMGSPFHVSRTRSGGLHIWYRLPADRESVKNGKWSLSEGADPDGDIRSDNGFVVVWDGPALSSALSGAYGQAPETQPAIIDALRVNANAVAAVWTQGERNESFNSAVWQARVRDDPEGVTAAIEKARESGLGEDEISRTLQSGLDGGERYLTTQRNIVETLLASEALTDESISGMTALAIDSTGLEMAMARVGVEPRYNERAARMQFRFRQADGSFGPWRDSSDRLIEHVRERIAKTSKTITAKMEMVPWRCSDAIWRHVMLALMAYKSCDPFVEWILSLPPWDGINRLSAMFIDLFDADNTEMNRWASVYVVLGALWRAFKPGYKQDESPVLIGPQGAGKSSALAWLFPAEYRSDWFSDSLSLHGDEKKQIEALLGAVIVEIPEMRGYRIVEIDAIKAFLSRTADRMRLAYRRDPETLPRRCVFAGTSNETETLPNDPSGNRRLVPVVCPRKADVGAFMDANRLQLWAEGLAMYRAGREARLPDSLIPALVELSAVHRSRDASLEDRIEERAGQLAAAPMTSAQVRDHLNVAPGVSDHALGRAMRNCGFNSVESRLDGRRARRWHYAKPVPLLVGF